MKTGRNERLTITELGQIRQRYDDATEGKWYLRGGNGVFANKPFNEGFTLIDSWTLIARPEKPSDARFIAHSRWDIPRLLTEVETLITEKAAARRMLDELIGEMANADEAGYALAPETVRSDLEKIRKELIDHGE